MKGYAQSNTRSSRTYPRLDERLNSRQTDLLVGPWSGRQSSVPGWAPGACAVPNAARGIQHTVLSGTER